MLPSLRLLAGSLPVGMCQKSYLRSTIIRLTGCTWRLPMSKSVMASLLCLIISATGFAAKDKKKVPVAPLPTVVVNGATGTFFLSLAAKPVAEIIRQRSEAITLLDMGNLQVQPVSRIMVDRR